MDLVAIIHWYDTLSCEWVFVFRFPEQVNQGRKHKTLILKCCRVIFRDGTLAELEVQNTWTHKYSKHEWNVNHSCCDGSKCLFIHNNKNQGPFSHLLVEYMVSNKDACTVEMHDLTALSGKEIPNKIPLPWHYVDLPLSSKYTGRTQSASLIVLTLHWFCRGKHILHTFTRDCEKILNNSSLHCRNKSVIWMSVGRKEMSQPLVASNQEPHSFLSASVHKEKEGVSVCMLAFHKETANRLQFLFWKPSEELYFISKGPSFFED